MAQQINNILKKIDWSLVAVYVILVLAGWFNIYAAVYDENAASIFDVEQRYGKQLIWIVAAFLLASVILIIDSGVYFSFSYILYGLILLSLVVVYFVAPEIKGARSWIEVGPLRIQPSEFAKLGTSLAVARYLGSFGVKVEKFIDVLKAGLFLIVPIALIVLQGDAGTSLVFLSFLLVFYREGMSIYYILVGLFLILLFSFSIIWNSTIVSVIAVIVCLIVFEIFGTNKNHKFSLTLLIGVPILFLLPIILYLAIRPEISELMVFCGGFALMLIPAFLYFWRKKFLLPLLLVGIGAGSVIFTQSVNYLMTEVLDDHQQKRINVFFGQESDPKGSEFNVIQSKIAIGSGDWTGKGFLNGTQTKYDFVPEQSTDFIFCTIGEEWGFVGSVIVIGLFVFLIMRIIRDAERQRTKFSRVYGYCVAVIFFFHIVINIGMTIGLMPIIGIPLPFFSYGGSSLWGFTILLFIFIKLDANREQLIQ